MTVYLVKEAESGNPMSWPARIFARSPARATARRDPSSRASKDGAYPGSSPATRPLLVCANASLVDAMVGRLYVDGWIDEDRADLDQGLVWMIEEAVPQGA